MIEVFIFNSSIIALAVIVHYEFLYRLSVTVQRIRVQPRLRIVLGVLGALVAHTLEICLFAVGYYVMDNISEWGDLTGSFNGQIADYAYFSFTCYTTLGFGDIEPTGELRFLAGLEALTGLVLITWTASFLYYEMQRYWSIR
jgi:Ion channel